MFPDYLSVSYDYGARFAVEDEINNLIRKCLVTVNQIKTNVKAVQEYHCAMINKTFEGNLLGSVILLSAAMC